MFILWTYYFYYILFWLFFDANYFRSIFTLITHHHNDNNNDETFPIRAMISSCHVTWQLTQSTCQRRRRITRPLVLPKMTYFSLQKFFTLSSFSAGKQILFLYKLTLFLSATHGHPLFASLCLSTHTIYRLYMVLLAHRLIHTLLAHTHSIGS